MLENYQMCHTHRQNKKGGGVAIYIKNNLDFNNIDVHSTNIKDVIEIVTDGICIKQRERIVICCIYKSPSVNYNDLNTELESLFDKFKFIKKHVFVCGDFAKDPMKYNENSGTQEFIDIMSNAGYTLLYQNQPE